MAIVSFASSSISGVVDSLPEVKTGGSCPLQNPHRRRMEQQPTDHQRRGDLLRNRSGDVRIAQSASDAQFEAWNKAQPSGRSGGWQHHDQNSR